MTDPVMKGVSGLRAGWILASGVLLLCLAGTWMTVRTYRSGIVTSTTATVLQNQWPESRIAAEFASADIGKVRPGMMARITAAGDPTLLTGRVLSVEKDAVSSKAVVAVVGGGGDAGRVRMSASSGDRGRYLPAGTACAVTVDGTIPPEVLADPISSPQ
jgi:multidrug resistance efflux pump